MAIARRGDGIGAAVRALGSQVHPVFMLPPLAVSLFGAVLAGSLDAVVAGVHLVAVFCSVYTAHVVDGYVDFYVRDEDDDHPMTATGCRLALVGSSLGFFLALGTLFVLVDWVAVALTLPGWVIAINHAPRLDTDPVGATLGYPLGVSTTLLAGYYVQAGALSATVLALAGVFLLVLSGIKVIDDATDYAYDRSIGKRTVAVALGRRRARRLAFGLMGAGMAVILALAALHSSIPPSGGVAALAFGAVALVARRAEPELATMLLIRGSYVFLAVLVASVWVRPLG